MKHFSFLQKILFFLSIFMITSCSGDSSDDVSDGSIPYFYINGEKAYEWLDQNYHAVRQTYSHTNQQVVISISGLTLNEDATDEKETWGFNFFLTCSDSKPIVGKDYLECNIQNIYAVGDHGPRYNMKLDKGYLKCTKSSSKSCSFEFDFTVSKDGISDHAWGSVDCEYE